MNLSRCIKPIVFFSLIFQSTLLFALDKHSSNSILFKHESNPHIYAAIPHSFPPFYYTDKEGLPYGFAIEVMNEIDHHAGFLTKYIIKSNWGEVFESIESGEASIIPNLGITEERKKHYFFTKPYVSINVSIIVANNNAQLNNTKVLTNKRVGVVKDNVGRKVASKLKLNNIIVFETIDQALQALLTNTIDAIIYPKEIVMRDTRKLGISDKIIAVGKSLKVIQRSIAVSKKHPDVFKAFNRALEEYMGTQDYEDTYTSWMEQRPSGLSITEYILLDSFLLLISIVFFRILWKKKDFSILRDDSNKKTEIVWVLTLIAILVSSMTIITGTTLWVLYETAFNEQRHRLIDTVKSRARLIESIVRYEQKTASKFKNSDLSPEQETISQVINAHNRFSGFGATGEFTLARHTGDTIEFILRHRHSDLIKPLAIAFKSELAVPMRLALLGHSGTIIGKDYRNEIVLAAYEPVSILNLGIVAKIDLSEIRNPFITSALFILGVLIIVTLLGSLLFFYVIIPIIQRMKETEHRFQQLFRNNRSAVLLVNPKNARIVDANEAAIKFYGYNLAELSTYNLSVIYPETASDMILHLKQAETLSNYTFTCKHRLQNGETRDVEVLTSTVNIDDETIIYYVITDITKRLEKDFEYQRLQNDLEQARKMEALGQLTGGIAHDFNNMLGVIMGYTNLSLEKFKDKMDEKQTEYLQQVLQASDRAKDLIAQMMIFSRSEKNQSQPMNIASLVKQDIKMLRSIIPSSIIINQDIDENLPQIMVEPVKLQQILMNLSVNAKDAMEGHGTLGIKLKWAKDVHARCQACFDEITGDWVELTVTDTGSGMSPEVIKHAFEPFFTTKEAGKGTGMGLAVIHGIVKDFEGHIFINSQPGLGTSIHLLFKPVYQKQVEEKNEDIVLDTAVKNKNIIIVDDESSLALLLAESLAELGYNCMPFSSPEEALKAFDAQPGYFDLVISDQTMPNITGTQMIEQMRLTNAELPAILTTGYSETVDENIADQLHIHFLEKPVNMPILFRLIQEVFIDS